jgi:PAS domain S-box-containing protein
MPETNPSRSKTAPTLRQRAETALQIAPPDITCMSADEVRTLVHELQVHQMEVKLQNEELLAAQAELARVNATLEQRVAERAGSLRESEARLRQVLEAGEVGMFELNLATGESNWNTVEFELLGIKPGDAPPGPETFFRFVHPDDAGPLHAKWDEALLTGQFDAEFRIVRADGDERWLAGKGRFFFEGREGEDAPDGGRRTARFLGVNHDITARKRAEESLTRSRLRLAGIVNAAMDAIISVDARMRVILFNEAAETMFGCPAAEAIGRSLDKFLPARFRGSHNAHIQRFGEAGVASRMMGNLRSVTGLTRDGGEFPAEASISQVNAGGQKIFTAILRDVTSRMRNEAVLRRQARLLHLSHDAILVWSTRGGIEYWNQGAMRLYGYDHGESMGREPREHLRSCCPTPWPQVESELRKSGAWEGMLRQTAKDGDEVVVSARMQIIAEEEDKGMVVLETNRDITDRQRLEEALLRAGEEERQRIGRDLHDGLGQEITAIALLNNLLQNSLKEKAMPEAAMAERLAELLKQAGSQVRRISHGLQPVPPDPDSLMTGIRTLVADASLVNGAECVLRCDGRVAVHNHESANHLYRIAQEAMQNALRHGKPGKVTVSLKRSGERVILEIQDDGAGFEPEKAGSQGIGLRTMRYRAEVIGGLLELIRPPEGGMVVRCSAPDPQPMP